MAADALPPATIEVVAQRLADLSDLFRRRLSNDRLQRELYESLCKRLEEADGASATQAVAPVLRQIVMVIDRVEAVGVNDPVSESVRDELLDILARQGVVRLPSSVGQRFDPRRQIAVSAVTTTADEEHGIVTKELRPAYLTGETVLRPAGVEVWRRDSTSVTRDDETGLLNNKSTERMEERWVED